MILVSCMCALSLWWRWISSVLVIIRIDDLPPITVHCLCPECVCVPQLRDRGQVTRLSQKFTMSKVDSLFLVGARKDMQRQWILKMGIFTKKPVVPSGRHDTYRIIALHPDGIFLIGQIYWSKCLVWTAVICECEFLSFSRSNVFCVYREASREWPLTHSRSLTLMQ